MNRRVVSLAAMLGSAVGFLVTKRLLFDHVHLTITLSKQGGQLKSKTKPSPIEVQKLQQITWHIKNEDLLGEDETVQVVFKDPESPLYEGNPKARKERGGLRIKGRARLRAKEKSYKYDVVHVVNGEPQSPPIEDPEIEIVRLFARLHD